MEQNTNPQASTQDKQPNIATLPRVGASTENPAVSANTTQERFPKEEKETLFSKINITIGGGIKLEDKMAFARNLSAMIKAGLPLARALSVLIRQSKKPSMEKVLRALSLSISKGKGFHESLSMFPRVFSSLFVAIIKSGEESGKLSEALVTIEGHLKESYELRNRVRGALIYPAIIVIAIVAVAIIMLLYVVPVLSLTFKELGVDLPLSTRAVIAVSDFFRNSTSLGLFLFAAVLLAIAFTARTKTGKRMADWMALHIPLISHLVKEVNAARTARTLASLLSAGVSVVPALSVTGEVVQNSYYNDALKEAKEKVEKGEPLSGVFQKYEKIYPVLLGEMTAVGEETGKMSELLLETALFYEEEVERTTRDMSSVIEPFLMVVMGIAVGFFALAMITPMYTLVGSI